jgi:hypothetical protein
MPHRQASTADVLAADPRPISEWAVAMDGLVPLIYEDDPELSRRLEVVLRRLRSVAANLDCIGTDDAAAPRVGAPARDVLTYWFDRWPEDGAEFHRVIARIDQVVGRRRLLELLAP